MCNLQTRFDLNRNLELLTGVQYGMREQKIMVFLGYILLTCDGLIGRIDRFMA
jgi:hypothetical protein